MAGQLLKAMGDPFRPIGGAIATPAGLPPGPRRERGGGRGPRNKALASVSEHTAELHSPLRRHIKSAGPDAPGIRGPFMPRGVLGTLTTLFLLCAGDRFAGIMGGRTSWGILGCVMSQTEKKGVWFIPRFPPSPGTGRRPHVSTTVAGLKDFARLRPTTAEQRANPDNNIEVSGAGDGDVRVSPAAGPPHPPRRQPFFTHECKFLHNPRRSAGRPGRTPLLAQPGGARGPTGARHASPS